MNKKLFSLIIALGIGALAFAQVSEKDAIKAARDRQEAVLMSFKLKQNDAVEDWQKTAKKSKQFLIDKTIKYKNGKDEIGVEDNIETVYGKVVHKKNKFDFKSFEWGDVVQISAKQINEVKNGKNKLTYEVVFKVCQCHAVVSGPPYTVNGTSVCVTSDARYDVTMTWTVGVETDKKTKKEHTGTVTLKSIVRTPANNEKVVLANANNFIIKELNKWFTNNRNSYFSDKVNGDEIIEVRWDKLQSPLITKLPKEGVAITVDNLPVILVYVDPQKHMSPDNVYENDPKAWYAFTPKFTATFSNNYQSVVVTPEEFDSRFTGPMTEAQFKKNLAEATDSANAVRTRFVSAIQDYSKNPTKENENQLKALFAKNAKVGVAMLTKQGNVNKKDRKVPDYLRFLKGATLNVESSSVDSVKVRQTPWLADVVFSQNVVRDKYCDHTKKRMHLIKDDDGKFKISSIEVIEDPTPCEQ